MEISQGELYPYSLLSFVIVFQLSDFGMPEKIFFFSFQFFFKRPWPFFPLIDSMISFCGISRPNVPLSESVIKNGHNSRFSLQKLILLKKRFFFKFKTFWTPLKRGEGVKILKMLFRTFLHHIRVVFTI